MRKTPALLAGKTARQIETILVARRVDRIINEQVERPTVVKRAKTLVHALTTLKPRKLNF